MTVAEVARVIDGRSFLLGDGREIRLAAIETPSDTPGERPDQAHAPGRAAKAALEALVLHHPVMLRLAAADRYGRVIAHAFLTAPSTATLDRGTADATPRLSVQGELLAQGYALLAPATEAANCRAYLRGAERQARAGKLGLWGDPYYVMRRAEAVADVLAERGQFAIVSGKVASVRDSGGLVYINFGRRWSEDFTVTILKRNERLFVGAGMEPKKLAGRHVEVRGFVEEHGGPAIEASRPEQIEIVEGN